MCDRMIAAMRFRVGGREFGRQLLLQRLHLLGSLIGSPLEAPERPLFTRVPLDQHREQRARGGLRR